MESRLLIQKTNDCRLRIWLTAEPVAIFSVAVPALFIPLLQDGSVHFSLTLYVGLGNVNRHI